MEVHELSANVLLKYDEGFKKGIDMELCLKDRLGWTLRQYSPQMKPSIHDVSWADDILEEPSDSISAITQI